MRICGRWKQRESRYKRGVTVSNMRHGRDQSIWTFRLNGDNPLSPLYPPSPPHIPLSCPPDSPDSISWAWPFRPVRVPGIFDELIEVVPPDIHLLLNLSQPSRVLRAYRVATMKPMEGMDKQELIVEGGGMSWVYPDPRLQVASSLATVHPKPPHYQGSLFCKWASCQDEGLEAEDVELNAKLLTGVLSAEEALEPYETAVGIVSPINPRPKESILWRAVTNEDIAVRGQQWAELVKNLVEGPLSRPETKPPGERQLTPFAAASLTLAVDIRSPSSSESTDLTDSDHSVDSDPVPSTPKPMSYASVTSPGVFEFSPGRPISLSAFASAFVPTSTPTKVPHLPSPPFSLNITPSPSPPHTNFTFPSLLPTLKKDEQGFYTEVTPPPSSSVTRAAHRASTPSVLPSFLAESSHRGTRGKGSKTRKMVEQLRSASAGDVDRPMIGMSVPIRPVSTPLQLNLLGDISTPMESEPESNAPLASSGRGASEDFQFQEGDGWLRGSLAEAGDYNPEVKARRTRDLVHALGGRNRGDTEYAHERGESHEDTTSVKHKRSFVDNDVFSAPSSPSPARRKSSRHRSRKSHRSNGGSSLSSPAMPPPMPLPSMSMPSLPTAQTPLATQPYYAPAYPIYTAPPSYIFSATPTGPGFNPILMQMQMPAPPYFGAAYPTPAPYGAMAMYGPPHHPHPHMMHMQPVASGTAGVRHAPW